MKLPIETSDLVRRFVKNCLCEAGIPESGFARRVAPWIPASTLDRLLNTDQPIADGKAEVLLHLAAPLAGLSGERLCRNLHTPAAWSEMPGEAELLAAECVAADGNDVTALVTAADEAMAGADRLVTFASVLPSWALDSDVMDKVLAHRVRRLAGDRRKALQVLREVTRERREAFMNFGLFGKVREVTLILTLSNLLRMVWLQPPFGGCSRDEVTDALESLIHDTVLGGRGVTLSVVNDIVDGPARRWAWPFRQCATVVLIEPGLLIKRRRGTLACRILRATSGELARTLLDRYRRDLSDGCGYACHGPAPEEVADLLKEFLTVTGRRVPGRLSLN
jgi:hypothetical protein